jgi:hypothetical protein
VGQWRQVSTEQTKPMLRVVGKNAKRNATPSAIAARKRYDRKRYKVLCSQVPREQARLFKELCEENQTTVNDGIKRLMRWAVFSGGLPE